MKSYPVVDVEGRLAPNDIWNVPDRPTTEVRGEMTTHGPWRVLKTYRALAMDKHGRIFGSRTLHRPSQSGHDLEGRVTVEGKQYRAFTSSHLFQREDGSLCNVAVLYVCDTPNFVVADPLASGSTKYLDALTRRYQYQTSGVYRDLADYANQLKGLLDGSAAHYRLTEEYQTHAAELRSRLAPVMGWAQ